MRTIVGYLNNDFFGFDPEGHDRLVIGGIFTGIAKRYS